jgi:hypothetical protein
LDHIIPPQFIRATVFIFLPGLSSNVQERHVNDNFLSVTVESWAPGANGGDKNEVNTWIILWETTNPSVFQENA